MYVYVGFGVGRVRVGVNGESVRSGLTNNGGVVLF